MCELAQLCLQVRAIEDRLAGTRQLARGRLGGSPRYRRDAARSAAGKAKAASIWEGITAAAAAIEGSGSFRPCVPWACPARLPTAVAPLEPLAGG